MVLNPVIYSNVIVPFYINKFLLEQLYEIKTRKGKSVGEDSDFCCVKIGYIWFS
jgi:predicted membrane-bound mannosyltransferase